MSTAYPYDADTRERVLAQLYAALPSYFRVQDLGAQPDALSDEDAPLRRFLAVLAGPLAALRQNVEELHADLFIDHCGDDTLRLLAEMVGTTLVFPDADTNRRDVRGTVRWRRRKGTPATLRELDTELLERLAVVAEGWKRVQMSQDLDILRLERVTPRIGPASLADKVSGPTDAAHHSVDARQPTASTGRRHPAHVAHWLHPSRLYPLTEGTPFYLGDQGDPRIPPPSSLPGSDTDWRYAFHPYPLTPASTRVRGIWRALRARAVDDDDTLRTDRVPPRIFAEAPGEWFGVPGRFAVRIHGLLAGAPKGGVVARIPSTTLANPALAAGTVQLELLAHSADRLTRPVDCALVTALLDGSNVPDPGSFDERARIRIDAAGSGAVTVVATGPVDPDAVMLLRLRPTGGALRAWLPPTTLAVTGEGPDVERAGATAALETEGFLRGALAIELPTGWVEGELWLLVAGDGSLYAAQSEGNAGDPDLALPLDGSTPTLDGLSLVAMGPGPAWPPVSYSSESDRVDDLPLPPAAGATVLHGGRCLDTSGPTAVDYAGACALAFAIRYMDAGVPTLLPMLRLSWTGPSPSGATWAVLASNGSELTTEADVLARLQALAALVDAGLPYLRLAVRFECAGSSVHLCPAEVALRTLGGDAVLVHLPELVSDQATSGGWDSVSPYTAYSDPVTVGVDGSTWDDEGGLVRGALGAIAPLRERVLQRRRVVEWRNLCPWRNEDPGMGLLLAGTDAGTLALDPEHGLFAFALAEPPPAVALSALGGDRPPNVTVDMEVGCTWPLGALPASREPALRARLPAPTRLVTRSGALHAGTSAAELLTSTGVWGVYPSVEEALDAIQADGGAGREEVVQIEDSATYPDENWRWPDNVDRLDIQAAEGCRPVFVLTSVTTTGSPVYSQLTLTGLSFGPIPLELPSSAATTLRYCSAWDPAAVLSQAAPADGAEVTVTACGLAAIELAGSANLRATDTVFDARGSVDPAVQLGPTTPAVTVGDGTVSLERVTVRGAVSARVLWATEVLFDDAVAVADRFHGCVRHSRVPSQTDPPTIVLPRVFRVVEGTRPAFVATDRFDPAWLRLSPATDVTLRHGAEDGGEIGAHHDALLGLRLEALLQRVQEYTPAGLRTGLIRRE